MFSRRRRQVLSIDIGAGAVKILELQIDHKRIKLGKYGCRDIDPEMKIDIANKKELQQASVSCLLNLLNELSINSAKAGNLITCLQGSQVSIKQITSVALSDSELSSSLVFEARKHLPVEGEVLMDYQVLQNGSAGGTNMEILLVVTTRQVVVDHTLLLESCGLKAGIIDAPPLAITNSLLLGNGGSGLKSAVLINVGAATTSVCMYHQGKRFFSRDIPIGGRNFTADIAARSGLDDAGAEAEKRAKGLFADSGKSAQPGSATEGLSLANQQGNRSLEALGREIMRSLRFYMKENAVDSFERFLVCGGSALGGGLGEQLSRALGTKIEQFDPFSWVGLQATAGESGPQYAQVLGMALRGIHELFPDQFT